MRIGLHVVEFEDHGKPIATMIKDIAQYADANDFSSISLMDHFFQIGVVGPPEMNMLEAYTTLGYLAALTERITLLTVVTGVVYRHPGILAKLVTTLDVLSQGRAWLGIGAAWNEREALGLGVPFPTLSTRFEMLEETLQIIMQMWSEEVKPFEGQHYHLAETLNAPQPITKPHPPILIGGGGEKKTLRLVAKYGDACNLFLYQGQEALQHKLDVLKRHSDEQGRDYKSIQLTLTGANQPAKDLIESCRWAGKMGFKEIMLIVPNIHEMQPLEILAKEVIPIVAEF
ncbi:MAG: LLM class F420-dependent oxidoreductase [Chloroflexota bacterium]